MKYKNCVTTALFIERGLEEFGVELFAFLLQFTNCSCERLGSLACWQVWLESPYEPGGFCLAECPSC